MTGSTMMAAGIGVGFVAHGVARFLFGKDELLSQSYGLAFGTAMAQERLRR